MLTFSLQSGSSGNAIYVEAEGVRLLFDAGVSARRAERRLEARGRHIGEVDAVLISHEHTDHMAHAARYCHKFHIPVYLTRATHRAARRMASEIEDVRYFEAGSSIHFNGVTVHTLSTPHDARDPVAFVVEAGGRRLGIFTDLGHPTSRLAGWLRDVNAAYLECNYDPDMLLHGGYPEHLKARIRGRGGHISNEEAANLLAGACRGGGPSWIAMAHLSDSNNTPQVAEAAIRDHMGSYYPVHLASRKNVSEAWIVR